MILSIIVGVHCDSNFSRKYFLLVLPISLCNTDASTNYIDIWYNIQTFVSKSVRKLPTKYAVTLETFQIMIYIDMTFCFQNNI